MKKDFKSKLIDLIKSPLVVVAFSIIVTFVVLLVVSINKIRNNNDDDDGQGYTITYEYDPASETEIANMPPTNGTDSLNAVRYVAADDVVNDGVPIQHWVVFKSVIEEYADKNNIDLFRVSYLHDSYKLVATYVFDFKVVLNIDQQTIGVRIDASKNRKDILGSVYTLSDEAGNELYRFEVTTENKCQFDGGCSGS